MAPAKHGEESDIESEVDQSSAGSEKAEVQYTSNSSRGNENIDSSRAQSINEIVKPIASDEKDEVTPRDEEPPEAAGKRRRIASQVQRRRSTVDDKLKVAYEKDEAKPPGQDSNESVNVSDISAIVEVAENLPIEPKSPTMKKDDEELANS